MTKANDSAFPVSQTGRDFQGDLDPLEILLSGGLTKREYFAAMAMQGILSDLNHVKDIDNSILSLQQVAVGIADSLIDALNRLPNQADLIAALKETV